MASYDRAFRSLGLPADFVISDGANWDLVVFAPTVDGPIHGGHGHFGFILDDNNGYSYAINRRGAKACYLKCIKQSCNARRILYYADALVSFLTRTMLGLFIGMLCLNRVFFSLDFEVRQKQSHLLD